jgi:hypothetical protein
MANLDENLPSAPGTGDPPAAAPLTSSPPDVETRRRAAAILEVLGGALSPAEAAAALAISLPRYYLLEARALEGLVAACEPRTRGRAGAAGRNLQALLRENNRLKQDLFRTQALARAVQRAAGVQAGQDSQERPRKRRKPRARALKAARQISPSPTPPAGSAPDVEPPP